MALSTKLDPKNLRDTNFDCKEICAVLAQTNVMILFNYIEISILIYDRYPEPLGSNTERAGAAHPASASPTGW
jgi:hypothetical protein